MKKIFLIGLALMLMGNNKCKKGAGEATSSSNTPGVVDSSRGFMVRTQNPDRTSYYIHKDGDFAAPCEVKQGAAAADSHITCTVEVNELEGYFHGISLVHNLPPGMCQYLIHSPAFHFGLEHGSGPTAVAVNFDASGNLTTYTVTPPSKGSVDAKGAALCNYSYTGTKPVNCCYGNYTLTTTKGGGAASSETKSWGGLPGNCAVGPAVSSQKKSPTSGIPLSDVYKVPATGLNKEYIIPAPISSLASSNLLFANYYATSDNATNPGQAPKALMLSSSYPGNAYHLYECKDAAKEVVASIKVMIREWNSEVEFNKRSTGDWDAPGTEPITGAPINDFNDWKDITNSYSDGFPGME